VDTLLFELEGQRYGLPAERVREIVRMVAINALPGAPDAVEGVVNVRGEIVPVYDLRSRFGLPARPVDPSEHLVLLVSSGRSAAIRVDAAESLETIEDGAFTPLTALPESAQTRHVAGVAATADGVLVIRDLDAFLSPSEASALENALSSARG
jgi:purine-binding chemotaxis protein CheW